MSDFASAVLARLGTTNDGALATLDPAESVVVGQALADRRSDGWRAHPAAMAAHLTRGQFRRWAYIELLAAKFRQLVDGTSRRQIWNLQARAGKSMLSSRWGPVWALDRRPAAKIILTSYADMLASEHATFVRDTLRQHADVLHAQLRKDRRRHDLFVTEQGGGLMSAGIMSGITGFGAGNGGGVIIDDPFKNWQEAHSATIRERVWNQYRSVLRLRLDDDDAFILIVHTRWHEDDLTGKLLKADAEDDLQEEFELVRLPALAEAHDPNSPDPLARIPDPLGRQPGEVLEPERFSLRAVRARAVALGPYLASALEQQRPAPEEGGEVRRDWWRWTTNLPAKADAWCISVDTKLKDREAGDFVVVQVWSRTGSDFWCHAQLRGQWSQRATKVAIALAWVRHPHIGRIFVENTGNGPEVMAELRQPDREFELEDRTAGLLGMTTDERARVTRVLRRGLPGLVPVAVKGSKGVRMRAVSGLLEAGNVHLPEGADWAVALVNEAAAFPNGAHDDMVDAMSQALSKLRSVSAGAVSSSERTGLRSPAPGTPVGHMQAPGPSRPRPTLGPPRLGRS